MIKKTKNFYNKIAEDYHYLRTKKHPEGWFYNELLEMPTTLKLLGNIKDKKVLDLGCGVGLYTKILIKKRAKVKGFDISEKEIEIARKENPNVEFIIGNAERMPYKNNEFDIVLAALVMEYFKDWDKVLKEVRRVLKKDGIFIFSIGNPVVNCVRAKSASRAMIKRNYFKEGLEKSKWWEGVYMHWYHKKFGTIVRLLVNNGFELEDYEDSYPLKKAKKLFPEDYSTASTLPYFCTWKWRKK